MPGLMRSNEMAEGNDKVFDKDDRFWKGKPLEVRVWLAVELWRRKVRDAQTFCS